MSEQTATPGPAIAPVNPQSISDGVSKLAERWGASVQDGGPSEREDTAPERRIREEAPEPPRGGADETKAAEALTERMTRREQVAAEHDSEPAPEEQHEAGEVGSGERDEPESGEPTFTTLEDLLNAHGVEAQALTVGVKRNGQEERVSLGEALEDLMREADYRQKTAAHAEAVKAFEAERAAAQTVVSQLAAQATALNEVLDVQFDAQTEAVHRQWANVDWNALAASDRTEFLFQQTQYERALQAVETHKAAAKDALEKKIAESIPGATQVNQEYVTAQRAKLVELNPAWAEPEAFSKGVGEASLYLQKTYGASREDLNILDARFWDLARKSEQRDAWAAKAEALGKSIDDILEAAANAPKVVEKAREAATLRPGAASGVRPASPQAREEREAAETLRKTGRHEDAVTAMRARLAARGL